MSTTQGFPDWQRITQWLGPPIVTHDALVIGVGPHADGPFQVSNFASVIVALKATGGNVTVTIKQTVPAGPAAVVLTESVVVAAGATLFEAFVLYGGAVELDLAGSVAGTSVDYALYGSNTTTNAQVITQATINVQHNEVLVAAEGTLDFVDVTGLVWGVADDAPNLRVKLTPQRPAFVQLYDSLLAAPAASFDIPNIDQTFNHLRLVALLRDDNAGGLVSGAMRFNNDAGANYDWAFDSGNATPANTAAGVLGDTGMQILTMGAGGGAGRYVTHAIDIPHYRSAAAFKGAVDNHGASNATLATTVSRTMAGTWRSLAALNRITLLPAGANFVAGSRVSLYGIL